MTRILRCGVIALGLAVTPTGIVQTVADSIRGQEWIISALHLPEAQSISRGSGVTVAIIDSGVCANHPDLVGNVLAGVDVSTGIADGDGLRDIDGHGTAMASLIVGHGHGQANGAGVLGVAPAAKVISVRDGTHGASFMSLAIDWATRSGVSVISISQSGGTVDPGLVAATNRAIAADIVVVAAVGNSPDSVRVEFPAALPGVLAVGGSDRQGNHANLSVTGSSVDLVAPAVGIVSADCNGEYVVGDGTSASTAIVAGAVALLRSRFPRFSAMEVIHLLESTAIDKGLPGRDVQYGYGLVDIVGALKAGMAASAGFESATSSPPSTPKANSPSTRIALNSDSGQLWPSREFRLFALSSVAVLVLVGATFVLRRKRR